MRRLHRKTLYSQNNSLDVRVEQLERRVYPQIQWAVCSLESFFGTVPANDGFVINVEEVIDASDNAGDWRIVGNQLHVPNLGENLGGGFFQSFCSVEYDNYLGYTVADPYQGGGPIVFMSIWDQNHVEIDADAGNIYRNHSIKYDNTGAFWTYSESTLYLNNMSVFADPPDGWHAHFQPSFRNDSAVANGTLVGRSLTVIRYGQAHIAYNP